MHMGKILVLAFGKYKVSEVVSSLTPVDIGVCSAESLKITILKSCYVQRTVVILQLYLQCLLFSSYEKNLAILMANSLKRGLLSFIMTK